MVTGVTSLMMVYRQERTKGVGAYHIVVSVRQILCIECSSIGGGRSELACPAKRSLQVGVIQMVCVSEGTTAGTQSAKQLRHTDYFPEGPFCLLHCYALKRNRRSNYRITITWGSGFKVAKKLCIYFIYTFRYVFVLFVLVIHI